MTAAILSYSRVTELRFLESTLIDLLRISTESPDTINVLQGCGVQPPWSFWPLALLI